MKGKNMIWLYALVFCLLFSARVFAEEYEVRKNANVRSSNETYLYISNGIAYCDMVIREATSVNSMSVHVYLQRNTGSGWKTYQTWIEKFDGNVADISKTTTVTSGADYRIRVFYYTYSSSGTGQYVEYSNEVSY